MQNKRRRKVKPHGGCCSVYHYVESIPPGRFVCCFALSFLRLLLVRTLPSRRGLLSVVPRLHSETLDRGGWILRYGLRYDPLPQDGINTLEGAER